MRRPGNSWPAIDVITTDPAQDAIEYGLMEAGALGTETTAAADGNVNVRGYFEAQPDYDLVRAALLEALRIYGYSPAAPQMRALEVGDRDWLAEWKKSWRPAQVGRFVIAPPWIDSVDATVPDSIVIRINPGMAFGTGTHETTRLCLKAIERNFTGGSFLDVGTGTGILAIAAALLFRDARIEAFDTDPDAIEIARENAQLNGVADRIQFRAGSIDAGTPSADFVCANLTAPVITELLPALLGATCGRLALSGILDTQLEIVRSRLLELAVFDFEVDQDGEWIALVV